MAAKSNSAARSVLPRSILSAIAEIGLAHSAYTPQFTLARKSEFAAHIIQLLLVIHGRNDGRLVVCFPWRRNISLPRDPKLKPDFFGRDHWSKKKNKKRAAHAALYNSTQCLLFIYLDNLRVVAISVFNQVSSLG